MVSYQYENDEFPGTMGAVDQGGLDIGCFAGAGDKGHGVGEALGLLLRGCHLSRV